MEEKSMTELFHGKDIADKDKLFREELKAIDEKYKDFFTERKSPLSSQEHDSVVFHCATHTANGMVTFMFTDNELPEHIKNDCIEGFKKSFPGAK